MKSTLRSIEGNIALVEVEFDAAEFERNVVDALRAAYRADDEAAAKDADATQASRPQPDPSRMILSTNAQVERRKDAVTIMRGALERTFDAHYDEILDRFDLYPVSAPYLQPVSGDIGEPIGVAVRIEVPPAIDGIRYEGLQATYARVVARGDEADAKIEAMKANYRVSTDDELLEAIGTTLSFDEFKETVERSIETHIDALNAAARREAAARALVEANDVAAPPEAIERLVDRQIEKMIANVGQEAFAEQLEKGPYNEESLREMIRRDVSYEPALNLLLASIAQAKAFEVSDDDRRREIAEQRASALSPDGMEPVDDTLAKVASDPSLLRALDGKVRANKALDLVESTCDFSVRIELSLKEKEPHFFR